MKASCSVGSAALRAMALAAFAMATQARELAFDVHLDGRAIGSHVFRITPEGDGGQRVDSTARFDVKLLGIRVYRYRHEAVEQWVGGCVQRLEATTDDNGDKLTVRGARGQAAFMLDQPKPESISSSCLSTYAYWNLAELRKQQHLLNPQTGKWDVARLESVGEERLQRKTGMVAAQHYRLHAADLAIDLWYAADGEWLQLGSDAKGNRRLIYTRRD